LSYKFKNLSKFSKLVIILGNPNIPHGGSSGCIAILTSSSSAVGIIPFIKYSKLAHNFSSSISLYWSNKAPNPPSPYEVSHPGNSNSPKAGSILATVASSYIKQVDPSSNSYSRSDLVQSNTGIKL